MIKWCSYCQKYLGEKKPFDDYAFTHTICTDCDTKIHNRDHSIFDEKNKLLQSVFKKYLDSSFAGDEVELDVFLDSARETGFRPLDLFYLTIQPVLCELGLAFQRGDISVAKEHRFTNFANHVLDHILRTVEQPSQGPRVLLVCMATNYHSIGVKALALKLRSAGVCCEFYAPALPECEILSLARESDLDALGISVATDQDVKIVNNFFPEIRKTNESLKLMVGGPAIQDGVEISEVDYVHNRAGFDELLGFLFVSNQCVA